MAAPNGTASKHAKLEAEVFKGLPPEQMIVGDPPPLNLMAKVLMIAIVVPVFFHAGDLLLTPSRVICIVLIPILTVRLAMGHFGRILITDFLIFFYSTWVVISYLNVHGSSFLPFAGSQVITLLGGYLVGRATIRQPGDFLTLSRFVVILIVILLPFAIIESQTGTYIIPALIKSSGFLSSVASIDYGTRMGVFRAQVVFAHPIHWGLYCSMILSLYFVTRIRHVSAFNRGCVALLILVATFFSVSSGPFLAALFQIALIAYLLLLKNVEYQWKILVWGFAAIYPVIEVSTTKFGMFAIAQRLAFNNATAYYRSLIWQFGTAQVERTPIFGVGLGWWGQLHWMTDSIDNFWLQMAVVNGIPASFSMIALFLISIFRAGRGHYVRGTDAYYARVAYTFTFVSLILSLTTVTVWNEVQCMLLFLIGAGQFMQQATEPSTAPAAVAEPEQGRGAQRQKTGRAHGRPGGGAAGLPGREVVYTRFASPNRKRRDPLPLSRS